MFQTRSTNRLSGIPAALRGLLLVTLGLAVAGCYESDIRVLNYGDQATAAGSYRCSFADNSRPDETVHISESVRGSGQAIDYLYSVEGGGQFRFTELDSGLFLGQTFRGHQGWGRRQHDARHGFAFFDMNGAVGFSILETSFSANLDEIGQMLERHGARFKRKPELKRPTLTLTGTPDGLFDFFNEHSRHMLTETVTCTRQD